MPGGRMGGQSLILAFWVYFIAFKGIKTKSENMQGSGFMVGVVLLMVGVVAYLPHGSNAQEELLCRGQELNMTADQKGMITDCLTESKIKSVWKIPAEKLSCFGVCILRRKGLLTADGKLDHDKIFAYVEMVMKPDEVKKPLKEGIEKCFKEHGDKVMTKDDVKCTTYLETGQCVHDVFFELCLDGDRRRRRRFAHALF